MLFVNLTIWSTFVGCGYWVAVIKRRHPLEGAAFGLVLGPLGCVVESVLRERTAEEVGRLKLHRQAVAEARLEARRHWREIRKAEDDRRREELAAYREDRRIRREEARERFAAWFDRTILKFGWYKALPEVLQPIVLGLLFATPLVVVMVLVLRKG
ncbi:hypothetical protein [Singulisphaera sp. PoT]|uniref:hypothetical protein n=1 Tax=Singulisphaera sp. PoT TaxID=3411797 RepID=UPI003BF53FD4